eukprot:scaffold21838_cov16-Tisochrysis_lutea.AAC.1
MHVNGHSLEALLGMHVKGKADFLQPHFQTPWIAHSTFVDAMKLILEDDSDDEADDEEDGEKKLARAEKKEEDRKFQ